MKSPEREQDEPAPSSARINQSNESGVEERQSSYVITRGSFCINHPLSYFETLTNMTRVFMGNGIFAMGFAFKNSGLILGIPLLVFMILLVAYCNHVLISSSLRIVKRKCLSKQPDMPDTVYLCVLDGPYILHSFAPFFKKAVRFFVLFNQFGSCCIFILFTAESCKKFADQFGLEIPLWLYMMIVTIPISITAMINNLKYLAPLSSVANILLALGAFITLYMSCQNLPPLSKRTHYGQSFDIPIFVSTFMYCADGIGVIIRFRNEMKCPEQFDSPLGVLNVSMFINGSFLFVLGFIGYLKYGEETEGSITLNLDSSQVLSQVVQVAVGLSVLFSYGLQFYILEAIIWDEAVWYLGPCRHPKCFQFILKVFLILMTLLVAELIPNLEAIIAIIGAASCTGLILYFPVVCDITSRWPSEFGCLSWRFCVNIFTIVFSVGAFISGMYFSIEHFLNISLY